MQLLRSAASSTWTDHNLHDPGITILEALCYAITEMGLRSGMEIRDLIASDVSGYQQELYTAANILPSAPATIRDFRKILLDHPLVQNAWLFTQAPPVLPGNYSVLLQFAEERLNSYTFGITVSPPSLESSYQVDVAFPHWDEEELLPFRADVTLLNVVFDGLPGIEWKLIGESGTYFSRITVSYQPAGGGVEETLLWVVAQINSPISSLSSELPFILSELTATVVTLGDNSETDETLLKQLNRRVTDAHHTMQHIRRYLKDYRNLCEDFREFKVARLQEVAISASIDVNPGTILEELLADIFLSVDGFIATDHVFLQYGDLNEQQSSEEIFEGPLLDAGFLPDASIGKSELGGTLYTSDILRLILQQRSGGQSDITSREDVGRRNIVSVRHLSLANFLDNRPITTNARDCLHLVQSNRHVPQLSLSKSRIAFYENGVELTYDIDKVIEIFESKKANHAITVNTDSFDIPLPSGTSYAVADYYPVQYDLPAIYGTGEAGLPEFVSEKRKALALQLNGYLFFFEQLIGGIGNQLASLNAIFSTDPELEQTIFPNALYHLPQLAKLLKSFDIHADNWEDFQSDEHNEYVVALQKAAQTEEQFLNQRNKILDHLLAILGENLNDRAALVFRRAAKVSDSSSLSLPDLLATQRAQRHTALRELIRDKSAFIHALPSLNRDKAQSYGNPIWRNEGLLYTSTVDDGINWSIQHRDEMILFRAALPASSSSSCRRLAAAALTLATDANHYGVVADLDGGYRLAIQQAAAMVPIAVSETNYPTEAQALAAIEDTVTSVITLWLHHALIPIESRLYHLLDMRLHERRQLIYPIDEYFEIIDNPLPNPDNEKQFRLWEQTGNMGDQLLVSEVNYAGATEDEAIESAFAAIQTVIQYGVVATNYAIENPTPDTYQVVLLRPDGTVIARSSADFQTWELAEEEILRIWMHLYRFYSATGFYLIEHSRLYPPADSSGAALTIHGVQNPYPFQASFVFPSGYARDFSIADGTRQTAQPRLHRDAAYRKYTETQIRKACPAHILPRVLWVDRALPGSTVPDDAPCFDNFERHYRAWLGGWFTDGIQDATIEPLRTELTTILNAIYQSAPI